MKCKSLLVCAVAGVLFGTTSPGYSGIGGSGGVEAQPGGTSPSVVRLSAIDDLNIFGRNGPAFPNSDGVRQEAYLKNKTTNRTIVATIKSTKIGKNGRKDEVETKQYTLGAGAEQDLGPFEYFGQGSTQKWNYNIVGGEYK